MIKYIEKRDGSIAKFNPKNIYNAVYQSAKSCNEFVDVDNVVRLVIERLEKRNQPTINIEIVQDEVEFVLMGLGYFKAAKCYITYRNMRDAQRNLSLGNINAESSVEEYLSRADWRVNANANQGYSLGGMILNVAGKVTANYWLNKIYPKEIGQAHRNGDIHIHDLDMLSIYCCGWSLKNVLREGMNGIAGKIESNPPKHLSSALNQALNHLCCCFTGDTKIWKADGSTITFQECLDQNIKELDVLSFNEKTGKVVKSHMTDIGVYKEVDELIELIFAFGDSIKCTPDHKFFTTKGWVEAKDLKFGNAIFTQIDGLKVCVKSIKHIKLDKKVPVFCGNVNIYHNFLTGDFGIVSHNCQNEAAGAQAYSSFDTYMAPYIRLDNLSYKEVKQHLQEFIYNLNVPSRWGCVPTSTEVLTTDGWKDSYTLSMKDKVYSINKKGELCLSTIKRIIHKKNASKKLIAFRNDHYNYEQLVTPEHRVLVGRTQLSKLDDLKIKRAENISGITNLPVAFTNSIIENSSPPNEEIMMAAALYCDGSWYYKEKAKTPRVFYFKSPNRQKDSWFEKLCRKLGVKYKKKKSVGEFNSLVNRYIFYGESARKLTKLVGRKTRIDEKFLNMSREKSQLFLDTWMAHDGQEEKHILQFDTVAIAKGLQHIAVNACKTSSIARMYNSQYVKLRGVEMLGVKQIQQIDYDGEVWCPSLTMGTAIFRDKNGCVFISGQTQTPFTNLTFDWVCPEDLKKEKPIVGGKECDFSYGDLQKEMDMINKAYIEIMLEGDKNGRVFTFPIPTYNITPNFNWNSENSTLLFEMTAKYGLPYFQNFINSELKPNMIRSMCPLAPDTLVYVKVNGKQVEETIGNLIKYNNIEVLCLNKWYPAKLNKSVKQKTRMICTENGCTEMGVYHLQPVLRNGEYVTVQAKELKVGDILPYAYNDRIVEKKILEINDGKERDDLYCFEVDSEENLFELKNGLITHNCRLQLDLRELLKRGNGLFGSAEQTGSIGVVTINCARLGYLFKGDKESLYKRLDYLMDLARNSLELKRKTLKQNMDRGLYPYIKRWLGTLRNHFSTIGVNGINEMIRNFTNDKEDITTEKGHAFAVEFLDHVRQNLLSYQSEQGTMYNLEATPAEGTTYRFAKEDKKRFPDIIQAGTESNPYYTNSSQLPVGYTDDPFEALEMQDDLQRKYTGGTVLHLYMNESISSSDACKKIVKRALTNFKLPYITITPTFSICPIHGYIKGQHEYCPKCDAELIAKKSSN